MGPSWEREEVESMVAIIQNCANSVVEIKVILEGNQLEKVSLEDKLRRAKMLLSDRQMILDDSGAEVAKCVEELRSVKSAIAKKSELVTALEVGSSNSEALSHLRREITNNEATCEKLIFHQGMEERTVARSQKVVLACEVDTVELSDQLENTIKRHAESQHRVLSMEKLVHKMTSQLAKMQDGRGAAFFPRPILESPQRQKLLLLQFILSTLAPSVYYGSVHTIMMRWDAGIRITRIAYLSTVRAPPHTY